jgi:hypothetical protein
MADFQGGRWYNKSPTVAFKAGQFIDASASPPLGEDPVFTIADIEGLQPILDGVVKTTGGQTIDGPKTFVQDVEIPGLRLPMVGGEARLYSAGETVRLYSSVTGLDVLAFGYTTGHIYMNIPGSELYRAHANSPTQMRQPRIFVQPTDPGNAAAEGDIWVNTSG